MIRLNQRRMVLALTVALAMLLAVDGAAAFPTKPVKIVVPYPPGGPADLLGRTIGQKLSEKWGQPVVVDNRPGAAGIIGSEAVAKSAPDGYTLLVNNVGDTVHPSVYPKLPYDVARDFAPITELVSTPFLLVVHPSVKATSIPELLALAKAKPGQLTFGSSGTGNPSHLAGELLKTLTGVDMIHVPYKGQAPAMTDVMGGQITMMFNNALVAAPHVRSGKLRAIAVTTATRSAAFADVPTIAETVPGYEVSVWFGLVAPARTPRAIVDKIQADVASVLQMADVKDRLSSQGGTPRGTPPDEFAAVIKAEIAKWAHVVKVSGTKVD